MERLIEWSEELSVGVDEIDAQHQVLVDLLNEFNDAIRQQKGSVVARDILRRLTDYTRVHFAVEESVMRLLGYPDYDEHKALHDELIDQIVALEDKLMEGKKSVNFELLHFLRTWLTKHIQETDRDYVPHFLNCGVQASTADSASSGVIGKMWSKLWG